MAMKTVKRPKCRGYMRHRWDPETGRCSRCKKDRNPKAKSLKKGGSDEHTARS